MDSVHEQVYIGAIEDVREQPLPDDVDAVVTVCQECVEDNVSDSVSYKWFNMSDGPANSYGGDSSYELFKQAARYVQTLLNGGKTVFVHCHMGQSRSAAVTAAALGAYTNKSYPYIIGHLKEQRPQVNPDGLLRDHAMQYIEDNTQVDHEPFYDND